MPSEMNVVQRIFRERKRGRSLREIAEGLKKGGIPTKFGGVWHASTVRAILRNEIYRERK